MIEKICCDVELPAPRRDGILLEPPLQRKKNKIFNSSKVKTHIKRDQGLINRSRDFNLLHQFGARPSHDELIFTSTFLRICVCLCVTPGSGVLTLININLF